MKQILFVILALLLSSQTLSAQAFELFFKVHDNGTLVNFLIEVYDNNNQLVRQGITTNSNDFGKYGAANGAANIYPGDQPGATFSQLPRSGT